MPDMRLTVVIVLIAVTLLHVEALGDIQSYAAHGRIFCDGKPAANLKVRLYDHDKFTADDLMGETDTAEDGSFAVAGNSQELTSIEPYLRIYHHCGDTGEFLFVRCPLNFVYDLESEKITVGEEKPIHRHDVGVINLRGDFRADEEIRQCLE